MSLSLLGKLESLKLEVDRGIVANCGICTLAALTPYTIDESAAITHYTIDELIMDNIVSVWPDFSGDYYYPVPSPICGQSSYHAYWELRKWEGAYGEKRKELLNFCIDYLKESLK